MICLRGQLIVNVPIVGCLVKPQLPISGTFQNYPIGELRVLSNVSAKIILVHPKLEIIVGTI